MHAIAMMLFAPLLALVSLLQPTDKVNFVEKRETMSDSNTVVLAKIGQIHVNVRDLDRAVAFYRDTLGVPFLFAAPPHMAFFDCDGIRLMLSIPEKPEFDHPSSILYFTVDDIKKSHESLSQAGVSFESAPHVVAKLEHDDVWMAHFRDSENNLMALMSQMPRE